MLKNNRPALSESEQAAGNGLLDRRLLLTATAAAIEALQWRTMHALRRRCRSSRG